MSSILDGLRVNVYGHSIAAWNDPWGWVPRMRDAHNWTLAQGAEWSSHSWDAVGQATAVGSPHRIDHSRRPHVVIVDAVANDAYGLGLAALGPFTTAVRSLAAYALLEGIINVQDCAFPSSWTRNYGEDYIAGRNVTAVAGSAHNLPGFQRAGKWAFFYYGLAPSIGTGGSWTLLRDGQTVGEYSCNRRAVDPGVGEERAYANNGVRGPRRWVLCSEVVDVPATQAFTVRVNGGGGAPFFAGYGKLNQSAERHSPLVVLVEPVPGYDTTVNAVLDVYAQRLHEIAASLPNVVVARTRTGWDLGRMARRGDPMHPNALGCQHYQDAIETAVDRVVEAGWVPNTHHEP
ncbi:hypothetical protein JOF41_007388 [Saccharothrix coeruleofusca]|uniref:hypothetical protein n=1 Tax=Saccharothrix coeruleofusca TaxID=33919 RepID=UPI001AE98B54|nr:hypothetical protein [Saccharothrix coeruleofusca]MBP2341134.1 hypothetical protein [Saccharothrix coeruleofusca]